MERRVLLFARRELLNNVYKLDAVLKVALDHLLLDTVRLPDLCQRLRNLVLEGLLVLEIAVVEEHLDGSLNNRIHQIPIINLRQLGNLVLDFHEVSEMRHFFK